MFKSIFACLAIGLAAFASAQGSAAGYGQGGGGGGFGGGGQGGSMGGDNDAGGFDEPGKPKDKMRTDGWTTKSAILTPSDKVTFKFEMKKGDSLFASVESETFDPGLSVVLDNKELLKVDDREEGDQSPFIAFRASVDGTYELNVLSFRSLAGGKFTLKSLKFTPFDWPLGKSKYTMAGREPGEVFMLAQLEAGQAYEVGGDNVNQLIGPTGVDHIDFEEIPTGGFKRIFLAKKSGSFYFRRYGYDSFEAEVSNVSFVSVAMDKPLSFALKQDEAKIVEFPIKENAMVRTTIDGAFISDFLSIPNAMPGRSERTDEMASNNTATYSWYKLNQRTSDTVRVFHMDGIARVVLRNQGPKVAEVKFSNRADIPEWKAEKPENSTLGIGETKLYLLNSEKSELIKVALSTDDFEPRLDIFRLNGKLANTLTNTGTHKPTDDLYFPDKGTFLVRVSCNGFGGKGKFELEREVLKPSGYNFGMTTTLDLTGSNFGLYSVNLVAGKRYEIMTEENGLSTRVDLIDPTGEFITTSGLRFEKAWVQYFIPKVSGVHRLWLRGSKGKRRFVLRPFDAPSFEPVKK